jgi:hypothetical protein
LKKFYLIGTLLLLSLAGHAQFTIEKKPQAKENNDGVKKEGKESMMNYATLNQAMQVQQITVDGQPFSFTKLSDTALYKVYKDYTGYSATRKEHYQILQRDLHQVDKMISNLNDQYASLKGNFNWIPHLKTALDNLKASHPALNTSGYDSAYTFCTWVRERHEFVEDSTRDAALQARHKEYVKKDSTQRAGRARIEKAMKHDDSVYEAKQKREAAMQHVREQKMKDEYRQECIRKFGAKKGNTIANGLIELGFTEEMVDFAWGSTDYTTFNTHTKEGTIVKKVFKSGKVLTFKKGILVAITE